MTEIRRLIRQYEPVLRFSTDAQGRPDAFFPMAARDYVHTCGLRRKKVGWIQCPGQTLLHHLSTVSDPDTSYLVFAAGGLSPDSGVDPQITLELLDYDLEIASETPGTGDIFLETTAAEPEQTPRLLLDPQEAAELEARLAKLTAVEREPATAEDLAAMLGEEELPRLPSAPAEPGLESFPVGQEAALEINMEWLKLPNLTALPHVLRESALEKYAPYRDWRRFPPVYHYHVVQDRGYKVLQYWFLYPYNDWAYHGGGNDHEGDWEVVYVFLDGSDRPVYVAYSQHVNVPILYNPTKAAWQEIEVVEGTHPVVYVGCGSHASYLERDEHRFFLNIDWAKGDDLSIGPGGDQPWGHPVSLSDKKWNTRYSGPWGALVKSWIGKAFPHTEGPTGPGRKGDKWHRPAKWAGIQHR